MVTKEDYPAFHTQEIFRALPEQVRMQLLNQAIRKNFLKGEYLAHQGDVWPYAMFVVSGQVRWAILAASGKEHLLFTIDQDQSFWAHSIFDDGPLPASLSALNKTQVLLWSRDTILVHLRQYPDALWEATKLLTGIMRQAREIIYGLAFRPVAGRLASVLLDRYNQAYGSEIERDFTLNELATRVAATPEVVCRVLYQFQEDGILKVTRASINVQDMDALKNLTMDKEQ